MTEKYRQYDYCQWCGSLDIEQSGYERDDEILIVEYTCQDCENKWFEYYYFDHNEDAIGNFFQEIIMNSGGALEIAIFESGFLTNEQ